MNLSTLEKRIRTLEAMSTRQRLDMRSGGPSTPEMNCGSASWREELEQLTQEAKLIAEDARIAGDLRTVLASIRVRCCIVELTAKLRGELDDGMQTNVLNIHVDSDTAKRIAETYLARLGNPEAR